MACMHVTASQLVFSPLAITTSPVRGQKPSKCASSCLGTTLPAISLKLSPTSYRYRQAAPICLFGGKGEPKNANEASPWKSLENALGNFKKEQSVEDILKQQIQKQEYYDGGSRKSPPDSGGGSGGGGGGGSGDGFGDGDDEGDSGMWDEVVQVILATVGFIFLYIYIIEAEEITVLAKDLIKFLFTRQKSLRLSRIVSDCEEFFERLNEVEEDDPYWLQREIINTTTTYDSPDKYRRIIFKDYLDSKSADEGYNISTDEGYNISAGEGYNVSNEEGYNSFNEEGYNNSTEEGYNEFE